jgi:hypothetical protein
LEIIVPKISHIKVVRDGTTILIIRDGRKALGLPWDAALLLARAITTQAKRAEEEFKALPIAEDQAVLMRSGAPFSLTSHPAIIEEAKNIALYDPKLRKHMKGKMAKGIGKTIVGKPIVILGEPK